MGISSKEWSEAGVKFALLYLTRVSSLGGASTIENKGFSMELGGTSTTDGLHGRQ